jgi:tripartite-type tricarboxylate transporter receptor subunit TctC
MSTHVGRIAAALGAGLLAVSGLAGAQPTSTGLGQAYPSKPIHIIIPFPPGAATDITGRFIAQKLGETLGQLAIAENRPGANGTIGIELAAKAPPDGYTLVLAQTGNLAISPGITKVNYNPMRDLAPISLVIASPHVLAVHPSVPAKSLKEVVAFARSRPGQLNYASTGSGSAGHLGMELLKKATGMDIVHVPYKGGVAGLTDLIAGQVAMMFTSVMTTAQVIKAGRVRVIAVGGHKRSAALPDTPTVAELGYPGFDVVSWWGLAGQAAMPKDIVARLNKEVVALMATQEAKDRIGALGADIVTNTPEQFAAYIKGEIAKWGQAIKDSGARVD